MISGIDGYDSFAVTRVHGTRVALNVFHISLERSPRLCSASKPAERVEASGPLHRLELTRGFAISSMISHAHYPGLQKRP